MSTLSDELIADAYFMRRLAYTRRIQSLAASVQFDLARSPVSDDDLDALADATGTPRRTPWGISDVLHDLLSSQPRSVPVNDLQRYQENLRAQGYLPPSYEPTGTWDDLSYSASRRFEEDNTDLQRSGKGFLSTGLEAGLRLITNTLPSRVWQGVKGSAIGIANQAGETSERVGLAGGALGGAAIGASIGAFGGPLAPFTATAGAIGGAVIGGVGGFFMDLFGEDPEEPDRDTGSWDNILDALSPYEEYIQAPQGVRSFYEDLGFVTSAASLISGVGLAAKGVVAGAGAARAIAAGVPAGIPTSSVAATQGIAGPSLARALVTPTPRTGGILAAAVRHPAAAGGALGGLSQLQPGADIQDVLEGAAFGAATGLAFRAVTKYHPGTHKWVEDMMTRMSSHNLISRPIFQIVNGAYTGLAAGQTGSRLAAGVGWQPDESTIEEAIRKTDPLPSVVDWASFFLYPTQWFPVKAGQLRLGFDAFLSNSALRPLMHLMQRNSPGVGGLQARSLARETVAKHPVGYLDRIVQYATDMEATKRLRDQGVGAATNGIAHQRETKSLIRLIKDEAPNDLSQSPTLARLIQEHGADDVAFEAWLIEQIGAEKRFDRAVPEYLEAHDFLFRTTSDMRKAGALVTEAPNGLSYQAVSGGGFRLTSPQVVVSPGTVQTGRTQLGVAAVERQIRNMQEGIRTLESRRKTSMDGIQLIQVGNEERSLREQLARAEALLEELTKDASLHQRTIDDINFVPARLDTKTRADVIRDQAQFRRIRDEVVALQKEASKLDAEPAVIDAFRTKRQEYDTLVWDISRYGDIPDPIRDRALRSPKNKDFENILEAVANTKGVDVQLAPDQMAYLRERGYKPVVTGEEVILPRDLEPLVATMDTPNYKIRRWFAETIGFSPRFVKEESLTRLTNANIKASVNDVLRSKELELGTNLPIDGAEVLRLLNRWTREHNTAAFVNVPKLATPAKSLLTAMSFKGDIRRLSVQEIEQALDKVPGVTTDVADAIYGALKRGSAGGSDLKILSPRQSVRVLARDLRVSGLPGAAQLMRSWHVANPTSLKSQIKMAAVGAAVGGVEGAAYGDEPLKDALKGVGFGAAGGVLFRQLAKRSKFFQYLPDSLANLNTTLRYTLSFTFDAGRYSEQNMIAALKYDVPMFWNPKKHVMNRGDGWLSPYRDGKIQGQEAWEDAIRFFDEINGVDYFAGLAEAEQRMFQEGMLGFSPRNFEAAQAWHLYQRGWSKDKIHAAVAEMGRYGIGRSIAERSANFVIFPFSFSKKLLTTLGDFVVQAPARNLLIHEGLRRYHESLVDEQFHDLVETRAPILRELWRINNLAFGISPGRFFFEGILDRRTDAGIAAQVLASFFVPSGAATPLQQAVGSLQDQALNLFVPVVITGESISRAGGIDGFLDTMRRYIPLIREADSYWRTYNDQVAAIMSPAHLTPWSQFQEYTESIRADKDALEPIATAMGYASVDGFLDSPYGQADRMRIEAAKREYAQRYPQGWKITTSFENQQEIDAQGLYDLAEKEDKTESEEAFLQLIQNKDTFETVAQYLPEDMARAMEQRAIRSFAAKWMSDRRFAELWARFMWRDYGPIRSTAI